MRLPLPNKKAYKNLVVFLKRLDEEMAAGATPFDLQTDVISSAHLGSVLFFGWLNNRNMGQGAEVLTRLVSQFTNSVYLDSNQHHRRYRSLKNLTKRQLEDFINRVEFAVPHDLWDSYVNPFDGLLLFFQFLEELGYETNVPRYKRALNKLKLSMKKVPCTTYQPEFNLTR